MILCAVNRLEAATSASARAGAHATKSGSGGRGGGGTFFAPLTRPPLDPPLVITGGFGEYRIGHFHAGLDLSTGRRVGKPVYAPMSGWIERVRASGVGYGRSIYLHTTDGRLIQFGHLDAYAEPLASYVAAIQDSSGQYEQDLWPETGRFKVKAGERIAWTGESGAGGPHLHFEIRRGDMAYHPLRAGLRAEDHRQPVLLNVTLEPLDDTSSVERAQSPRTVRLGAARETVLVEGRLRAIVAVREGTWQGVDRMVPWSTAISFAGEKVEARFDSVSWATDMPEGDYVYDAGRVIGEKGLVMWAPAGWRPRVIVTNVPLSREAGTMRVGAGERPRPLTITARDLSGHVVTRVVMLRGPRSGERGLDRAPKLGGDTDLDTPDLAALPWPYFRRSLGSRSSIFRFDPDGTPARPVRGRPVVGDSGRSASGDTEIRWTVPEDARFEPGAVFADDRSTLAAVPAELVTVGSACRLRPATTPLRRAFRLVESARVEFPRDADLYRYDADGWTRLGATRSADGRRLDGESRAFGTFAVFRDTLAPRITPVAVPKAPPTPGPYNRWAIEARLAEDGSGVDPRASYVSVDGRRMSSEWDGEEHTLRWRPLRLPAKGPHAYEIVAADRAGNVARRAGSFVLD